MFSFGGGGGGGSNGGRTSTTREDHRATVQQNDINGNSKRNSNSKNTSSFSVSPAASAATSASHHSSSPLHMQQQQQQPTNKRRGSGGGGGGFSPRSIGKAANASGKKFLGSRRFGLNRRSGGGGGGSGQKQDLSLDVNETSDGVEVSFIPTSITPLSAASSTPRGRGGDTPRSNATPQRQKHIQSRGPKTPQQQQDESREPSPTTKAVQREPVISLKDQLRHRQRVWRSQYSVAFPALGRGWQQDGPTSNSIKPTIPDTISNAAGTGKHQSITSEIAASNGISSWRPKGHRIPLVGVVPAEVGYSDALHLLQSTRVADERSAVQEEIKNMEAEITALEKDRKILERHVKLQEQERKNKDQQLLGSPLSMFSFLQSSGSDATSNGSSIHPSPSDGSVTNLSWDGHKLLKDDATQRHLLLSQRERLFLQNRRGNSLTIRLDNPRTKEIFIHRCGGKLQQVQRSRLFKKNDSIVTLHPGNCRSASQQQSSPSNNNACSRGAATDLQHVELIASTGSYNGFFLARDSGKSQTWGRIPNKLYRRMKQEGAGAAGGGGGAGIGDLVYLSTGPHGSYYAEFQSGVCWWGSAVEDADFHNLMRLWDVYRVAFGPIESIVEDEHENKTISSCSWIILSRDGRAAWKNLPSRLSHKLEERLASWAAPAEVSLGPGDSYFVRFLDGQVDYCLPAETAQVCEKIESKGGRITNICLHPEISNGFIIRHTEMTR